MGARRGLLLTDVEASTAHLRDLGDRFASALAQHFAILRAAIEAEDGLEVGSEGDSIAAVLPSAAAAYRAAVAAQRGLLAEPWPEAPWRVRMAVHVGEVVLTEGAAVGLAIHEAARIRDVGHGGQVLVSGPAAAELEPDQAADLVDLGRHEVRDVEGGIRILQVAATGLLDTFPPLRTAHHADIPTAASSFIGRTDEIEAVSRLLDEHRLVTLVGVGGSGKTRLAFEVAGRRDGGSVSTVELAALTDGAQVRVGVAAGVGARTVDDITTTIGSRPLLLILDNCEHLLAEVVALVAELLGRCPGLRVLCTSREPLAMSAEATFAVPPLSAAQSAQLFLERAPRWLDEVQRATVESICGRLAGIPLAIELAAARLRSIDAEELAGRLDDQLTMLTGGARDVPRQQTMRATLDWSHDLLGDDERVVFRRLAVFAGGCTVRAAEAVAAHPSPIDVLTALDSLVQRSLVVYDPRGARYGMLEPVRQYALEQLQAAGEAEAVRVAHRDWAMHLAADGNRGLFVDQARWTSTLDAEATNLGAAIGGALGADEVGAASTVVASLAWYWFTAGRGEGTVWIPRVLERADELDERGRARTLLSAGILFCDEWGDARALDWLAQAEEIFRSSGNRRALGAALFWRGRALAGRTRALEARPCFEEGAALHEELGDPFGQGWCLTWLSVLAVEIDGDIVRAGRLLDEATDLAERTGVPHVIAAALGERGHLHIAAGELELAADRFEQSLALFREVGDRWQVAIALHRRAALALVRGPDLDSARPDLVEAIEIAESLRSAPDLAAVLRTAAQALLLDGRREDAAELGSALAGHLTVPQQRGWEWASGWLPDLRALLTDPERRGAVARGATLDLRSAAAQARAALLRRA